MVKRSKQSNSQNSQNEQVLLDWAILISLVLYEKNKNVLV